MSAPKMIRFAPRNTNDFYDTLKQKVDGYFEQHKVSRHGYLPIKVKAIVMLLIYIIPYVLLLSGIATGPGWLFFLLWIIMGVGMSGIGLSIMHDANHGSFSKNETVNNWFGRLINAIGGHATNWKIQHNLLHHTYTNVHGMDEDITSIELLRFSPHQPLKKMHRYQHWYAWFFYSLLTLNWVLVKDFSQLFRYDKGGQLKMIKSNLRKEIRNLLFHRVVYLFMLLVLPIILLPVSWYWIVIGFVVMHLVAGLLLSCIFQPAHVMESSEFPMPENNHIANSWAVHQLLNTANFSPRSRIFSWFVGGLNFQIEHHLFPNISHIHYRKLSGIVEQVAIEFGLPYHVQPTFVHALWYHKKMLKALGR